MMTVQQAIDIARALHAALDAPDFYHQAAVEECEALAVELRALRITIDAGDHDAVGDED